MEKSAEGSRVGDGAESESQAQARTVFREQLESEDHHCPMKTVIAFD